MAAVGVVTIAHVVMETRKAPIAPLVTVNFFKSPWKFISGHYKRIPRKKRWLLWGVGVVMFILATRLGAFVTTTEVLPPAYQQATPISSDQVTPMLDDSTKPVQKVLFFGTLKDIVIITKDAKSFRVVDEKDPTSLQARLTESKIEFENRQPETVTNQAGHPLHAILMLYFVLSGIWGALCAIGRGFRDEITSQQRDPATTGWSPTVMSDDKAAKPEEKQKPKETIKFEQVGGADEALERCKRIVHFMSQPELFALFGSEPPKGVLLMGPPGTGKTLLARATAGEVDAHILVASGSEMVQMYVGVGATRIRELFKEARRLKALDGRPAIIFIDEIDAFGKQRGQNSSGGGQEYDQTTNQLLTEMDGYTPLEGIIVMAATNLGTSLDSGLMRRFTYHVVVDEPDMKGRLAIFEIHTKGKTLAADVSLEALARRTPNFVGDNIKKVVVEAATLAAIRHLPNLAGKSKDEIAELLKTINPVIEVKDFDEAIDSIQYGDARLSKSRNQKREERMNTAVHEIGHAVVPTELGGDPVTKISVMMRGMSLGMMQMHSESQSYGQNKKQLLITIKTLLAGRLAQEVILGEEDTGASNDFERASKLARMMVGAFGMSSQLGFRTLRLDADGFPVGNIGAELSAAFTEGWSSIITECAGEVRKLIETNKERITKIADILVEEESMLGDRFRKLWTENAPAQSAEATDKGTA